MTAESKTAPQPVRVAIADDSDDLCLMLAELVNASPGLLCVAKITAQRDLLAAVTASQPDVLVLDLLFGGISSLPLVPQLRAASIKHAHRDSQWLRHRSARHPCFEWWRSRRDSQRRRPR